MRLRQSFALLGVIAMVGGALTGCASTTQACGAAMGVAAGVTAMDNDDELVKTLDSCQDADDWVVALQQNPGAGSLTDYTRSDAYDLLGILCAKTPTKHVCEDAAGHGWIPG